MLYRRYCRAATIVFLLFTIYPLVTKLVEHRLAHDWAHGVLHLGSATLAAYAGWFARPDRLAVVYTWAIAAVYGILGAFGWFTEGLLLGTAVAIPLGAVDNVFHLALAAAAVAVIVRTESVRPRVDAAAG